MKLRTSVILVLVTGLVLAVALLAVVAAGRFLQFVRDRVQGEAARKEFVARWRRPAELRPDLLLPPTLLGRTVGETRPQVTQPALGLDQPGVQGVYTAPGQPPITVAVLALEDPGRRALLERARARWRGGPGRTSALELDDRWRYSRSEPPETLEIWALQGWTFLFQSAGELPAEFVRAYLTSIAAAGPAPTPAGAEDR